jgi:hypothetical protein
MLGWLGEYDMRKRWPCLASLVLGLLLSRVPADAQCPPNPVSNYVLPPDPQASYAEIYYNCLYPPPGVWLCGGTAHFDLHQGTVVASSISYYYTGIENDVCYSGYPIDLAVADLYTLVGPVSPTQISFEATLHVTANHGWDGHGSARLVAGPDSVEFVTGAQQASAILETTDLTLPLARSVGAPFPLTVRANAVATSFGSCAGMTVGTTLGFRLPTEYSVTSCHGFIGQQATPAGPVSWGRLKTFYR